MSPALAHESILVVDDQPLSIKLMKLILEGEGYHVLVAANATEALQAVRNSKPDLILMDLYMPKHDGFTSVREIHRTAELREVPIIAISAYGDLGIEQQLRHDAPATGFAAYLAKPFDPSELLRIIQRLLHKKPLSLMK